MRKTKAAKFFINNARKALFRMARKKDRVTLPSAKKLKKYYADSRHKLINIFYGGKLNGFVNNPEELQFQLVLDSLALFMCALDGNAFYNIGGDGGEMHHQQYYDDALEVLDGGFKGFAKKRFKNIPIKSLENYTDYGRSTFKVMQKIPKELEVFKQKQELKKKDYHDWINKNNQS